MLETANKESPATKTAAGRLILLIEDEPDMAQEIARQLDLHGYDVESKGRKLRVLNAARSGTASLLILDRMLHGVDSLPMVQTLRSEGFHVPVLFVSALTSVDERIHGLKAGGDDYITKPFAMGELAARVEALLRRSSEPRATKLKVGPLELDLIDVRPAAEIANYPCCLVNSSCSNI